MKILYIIGNGLDIAYNLKTSYQDFFKYYLRIPSDDKDIQAMKKDINSHSYETWADLEIGMGLYSSHCANKGVFLKCLFDIKSKLKEYLQMESEKIKQYSIKSYADFLNPSSFLDPEPRHRYGLYCKHKGNSSYINVMTFNYTTTLEWLFGYNGNIKILSSPSELLMSITHVHGLLDDMMVMGVNDISQISNGLFNADEDIIEEFVKPEYNDACMNNKNNICRSLIQEADIIVLYGTSLGKSDVNWWKLIGQRMSGDEYPLLIYLPYDETKDQVAEPNHLRRWFRERVREIKEKFGIELEEKDLASRVCVAFNRRIIDVTKISKK